MTMPTAPTDSSDAIFEYLVAKSRQNLAPVDEVYLTLDDIAAGTGKSKRSVSYALDRLTKQGKVVDRKPRKIRIKVPNGAIKPQSFHGADLTGQNLRGRNFRGMDLSQAKLDGANLRDTTLSQTSFKGANLEGANLRGAHAAWADFGESNLVDVDAIGTAVTRSNLIGAHVDGLRIGTPLAQFSLWDNVAVEPEQLHGMVGISYTHFVMASMFDQVLNGKPATPFISGMIESERYGCWKAYLTRMALYYPEYFIEWVRGWRDPRHDKLARVWMEFELMRTWQAMHGVPEPEIYERLIDPTLPRTWLVYFRLLAKHWQSIRTTNPIESTFATIRHRTKRSRGCLTRDGMLHMMFKLGQCAEKNWRRLRGFDDLVKVITGVKFNDGIEVTKLDQTAA